MPNAQGIRNKANSMMAGFSPGQRAVIAIAALTIVVGGVIFATWASKPTMVPLYSNLSASDASSITGKLTSAHVQYKLTDGGATILVPQSQVYQQRLNMAGAGLPNGGSDGYTLLDKQGITTSDFLEHVDYQRAVAGELEKTIESIQGVSAATVNLNIPQTDVFSDDSQKPSASVLVSTDGSTELTSQQVQSIVNLVAGAVDGLDPNNVTVADNKGRMLASPGQGVTAGANDQQDQATSAVETDLNNKIQALLTPLVGQGKAVVQANASLNFDKINQTTQVYNPNNKPATPTSQSTQTETYNNATGANATGCLGANVAVTSPACQAAATGTGGSGTYTTNNNTQDNAVDQTVTQTETAPGAINRISVAVLLDSTSPVDTQQVTQLVTQAAGLQPSRGDTVTVSALPFDKTQAQAAQKALAQANKAKQSQQTLGLVKTIATVLIIGAVLGLLFITTKRRANNYTSTPISLAELDAAMPALPSADDMLAAMDSERELENSPEALERAKVDKEITGLIERQPDEVAALLRSWLADRRG